MLTDISSRSSRYSQSDGKLRYGTGSSQKSIKPFMSTEEISKQLKSFMQGDTSRRLDNFNPQNQTNTKLKRRYQTNKNVQALPIKSIVALAIVLFVVLATIVCNINIQVGQDDECWEKFKQNNCNINNVQGKVCTQLFKCISKPQYQLSLALILFVSSCILLGLRFKRQIKKYAIMGIRLWEKLIVIWEDQKNQ